MTPAQHDIIAASCARAAELWAIGHDQLAERWFSAALEMTAKAGDFIDIDDRSTR